VTLARFSRIILFMTLCVGALSGCSGTMQGMLRGSGQRVTIAFTETGMAHGTLRTTLPSGEHFEGKHVYESSSSYGTVFGQTSGGGNTASGASFGIVTSYSGNNRAILFGDRGHSMNCSFQVVDPITGMSAGGVGVCQVSDGDVIDVQF